MSGFTEEVPPESPVPNPSAPRTRNWAPLGELAKFTAVFVIMAIAFFLLKKKLADLNWEVFWAEIRNFPPHRAALAILITAVNYVVLTGYDLIAVRYLKKQLPLSKVMTGAIVGYSMSNLFGWIFGGSAVRYRLYSSWGFSIKEIVAFISILSMTFWLGMFLLAGCAFVALPVRLPDWVKAEFPEFVWGGHTYTLEPYILGWVFLAAVAGYLLACTFWRKPIRWGDDTFALPPLSLSTLQLVVSAADFALASAALYVVLPSHLTNFSTVLVTYLVAMIVVVTVHAPGGFGILDGIVLSLLLTREDPVEKAQILCALVVYRIIYYFLPGILGGVLLGWNEWHFRRARSIASDNK